jgi:hypothetical protein
VSLVCGDFLAAPLHALGVVFTHNMVFTRALQRALQLKMDRELPAGACVAVPCPGHMRAVRDMHECVALPAARVDAARAAGATVFTVLQLQYTKRGVLTAELEATYNWASGPRPLYQYAWLGPPLSPGSSEAGSPRA